MLFECQQASFAFDPENPLLQEASFTIEAGQHTSLSGPSGAGKSTVLKLMANLLSLDQGTLYFKGQVIDQIPYPDYRKSVSYVMQNPVLFGKDIYETLAFPAHIRDLPFDQDRARDLLARLRLSRLSFDHAIADLSGGEAQRIGLIRNLLYPPALLLLDEVTASLDAANAAVVWEVLFDLAQEEDMTLVWISHQREDQKKAEQALYLGTQTHTFQKG